MNEVCGTDMPLDGDLGQHATSADPYGTADAMNELIQEDQGLRWVCILHDIMNAHSYCSIITLTPYKNTYPLRCALYLMLWADFENFNYR